MPLELHAHMHAVASLGHAQGRMKFVDLQLPAPRAVVHFAQVGETVDGPDRGSPGVRHTGHAFNLQDLVSDVVLECGGYPFILPEPRITYGDLQQCARAESTRKVAGRGLPAI